MRRLPRLGWTGAARPKWSRVSVSAGTNTSFASLKQVDAGCSMSATLKLAPVRPSPHGQHFELAITDTSFAWSRMADAIAAEAALDGIYVIRRRAGHRLAGHPRRDVRRRPRGAKNYGGHDLSRGTPTRSSTSARCTPT